MIKEHNSKLWQLFKKHGAIKYNEKLAIIGDRVCLQ